MLGRLVFNDRLAILLATVLASEMDKPSKNSGSPSSPCMPSQCQHPPSASRHMHGPVENRSHSSLNISDIFRASTTDDAITRDATSTSIGCIKCDYEPAPLDPPPPYPSTRWRSVIATAVGAIWAYGRSYRLGSQQSRRVMLAHQERDLTLSTSDGRSPLAASHYLPDFWRLGVRLPSSGRALRACTASTSCKA